MIVLCNTFLPNDRVHAISTDIGKLIRPLLVIDRFIEVGVAQIITIVYTDSKFVFRVL